MHYEKNISKNFMKTTLGEKDMPSVKANMQACGIWLYLHMQPIGLNCDKLHMPNASCILSTTDKAKVLQVLKYLWTPMHYVSMLHIKISKRKLSGVKSHDFHVLL